ncbi:cell envelope biogenesis protein OmpA [Lysobacter arseniciresistens ZS79]|uniref:Cell envelope biogenesis protein OmpA n=1 Tax=Lysobacter arseniciresistens ZS79 TaxID=913325 RepID=A0A0A0F4N5_9GAMM|nr:OmpA family protein [Lysobacter arseniciresistens]KGM57313.1 cell envelope biogenesis protein OmpA [Lysobacter arseniciresistens ZS79]
MKPQMRYTLAAAVMTAMLAGCATSGGGYYGQQDPYGQGPDPSNDRTKRGAIIGAAVGAVAGLLSGDDATERRQRALVGAGVGGLAGGAIGNYQDRQERALRERMAGTGVDVVRQGDNITLNMPDNITFGFDSSALQPQFYPVLDDVAATLREYNQTIVEVAGHTDSKGTDAYNQELSVRRADSVGDYLMSKGLMRDRFIITGAGESRPIASNDTDAGRAKNRRVEITLVPIRS